MLGGWWGYRRWWMAQARNSVDADGLHVGQSLEHFMAEVHVGFPSFRGHAFTGEGVYAWAWR